MYLKLMLFSLLALSTGCQALAAKPNLVQLAQQLNLNKFVEALKQTGVDKVINHEGFYTVFAPSDAAFAREVKYPSEGSLVEKIQFHVVRGKYSKKDFKDEDLYKTLLSKRSVRYNLYPNGKETANGRVIESFDHEAHNGVIHIMSDVMSAVFHKAGSVVSELEECCPQHKTIQSLVTIGGLYRTLDQDGPWTFFAPTDNAFSKLHPDYIIHLKKNLTALREVVLNHVVQLTWNSPGFQDGLLVQNMIGANLTISVNQKGLKVGKADIVLSDITAQNGVIHSIDDLLFPKHSQFQIVEEEEQLPLMKLEKAMKIQGGEFYPDVMTQLRKMNCDLFAQALVDTNMDKFLSTNEFTLFAPTNSAFSHAKTYPTDFTLEDKVRMHISPVVIHPYDIKPNSKIQTLLEGRFITFDVTKSANPLVNYVILANGREFDLTMNLVRHGVMFTMPSVPMDYVYQQEGTIYNEVGRYQRFSKFFKLIADYKHLLDDKEARYTLLVADDDVIDSYLNTNSLLDLHSHLNRNHILTDNAWFTKSMEQVPYLTGMDGKKMKVKKAADGKFSIGGLNVLTGDFTCVNGVFHQVDGIIQN